MLGLPWISDLYQSCHTGLLIGVVFIYISDQVRVIFWKHVE